MKHRNILYITIILFIGTGSFSCKKFLDKKPADYLATPETLPDLQALLDKAMYMNHRSTPSFNESSADDYFLLPETYNALYTDYQKIYKWTPYDYVYENDWGNSYYPVYNANICLEKVEEIPVNGTNREAWDNVKGSALFFRSYYFLGLTWQHAKAYDENNAASDLGIVLRLGSDATVPSVRSNVKQSYEQVIRDAKEASMHLPDLPAHVLRPSKAAAYGLLARAYLSMRQYDSALKYSDLCLTIKSDLLDYNSIAVTAAVPFQQFNAETIFYTEKWPGAQSQPATTSRAKIDTTLYAAYETNDLRKTAFFLPSGGYHQFKGSYAQSSTIFFTGIATDEMLLTRAECYARGGVNRPPDKEAALDNLNTLLSKRYDTSFVDVTAANSQEALNRILLERRKELLMRGLRWIDIKRLNKEGANIVPTRVVSGQTFVLEPNANYYALPLPADIIALTGMPQNPYP